MIDKFCNLARVVYEEVFTPLYRSVYVANKRMVSLSKRGKRRGYCLTAKLNIDF